MNDVVYWIVELAIKPGQFDAFKDMMNELIESASAEAGTLNYEWNISEDETRCHVYERYADSEAAMIHSRTFAEQFAENVLAIVDVANLTVYGNPNDEVKDTLSEFGAVFMAPIGGFVK